MDSVEPSIEACSSAELMDFAKGGYKRFLGGILPVRWAEENTGGDTDGAVAIPRQQPAESGFTSRLGPRDPPSLVVIFDMSPVGASSDR